MNVHKDTRYNEIRKLLKLPFDNKSSVVNSAKKLGGTVLNNGCTFIDFDIQSNSLSITTENCLDSSFICSAEGCTQVATVKSITKSLCSSHTNVPSISSNPHHITTPILCELVGRRLNKIVRVPDTLTEEDKKKIIRDLKTSPFPSRYINEQNVAGWALVTFEEDTFFGSITINTDEKIYSLVSSCKQERQKVTVFTTSHNRNENEMKKEIIDVRDRVKSARLASHRTTSTFTTFEECEIVLNSNGNKLHIEDDLVLYYDLSDATLKVKDLNTQHEVMVCHKADCNGYVLLRSCTTCSGYDSSEANVGVSNHALTAHKQDKILEIYKQPFRISPSLSQHDFAIPSSSIESDIPFPISDRCWMPIEDEDDLGVGSDGLANRNAVNKFCVPDKSDNRWNAMQTVADKLRCLALRRNGLPDNMKTMKMVEIQDNMSKLKKSLLILRVMTEDRQHSVSCIRTVENNTVMVITESDSIHIWPICDFIDCNNLTRSGIGSLCSKHGAHVSESNSDEDPITPSQIACASDNKMTELRKEMVPTLIKEGLTRLLNDLHGPTFNIDTITPVIWREIRSLIVASEKKGHFIYYVKSNIKIQFRESGANWFVDPLDMEGKITFQRIFLCSEDCCFEKASIQKNLSTRVYCIRHCKLS
ncbi:unnamed protein product [Orchesella dallaii]|uniref:Uncharacterized protein n=1 Tax=Orchesella dallaii TaxID=48710 RepID=A0ABP1Q7E8_9HEXA